MKKNILFFIYIFVSLASVAQNNIGIGTNTPNPNAKLDISSTTKGLLIPRMSSAQRITLAGTLGLSDEGLMVYDTDLQKFYYWDKNIGFSGNWNQVRPGSLSYGKIWIGDATNTAVERSMSGDVTISDTGLATIQPNAVQGTDISLAGETTGNIMQFNGTDWVPVDPSTLTVRNIYTANGTLTGNRTMTMAANSLNLNATNGNFIYNPSGTGKMGIGGTPSTYKLEVIGSDASINNVRVGLGAGNIAGNTVVGSGALNANTSGFVNTAIGYTALAANTTGADNTAIGMDGMLYNTSGSMNTSIGTYALVNNTTGNYNSGIGKNALYTNSTGSNNTALGYNADVSTGALTNATAIGSGAIVSASNSLVLGNGANVGIGISNPTNKLEVVGNTKTSNFQMTTGATNNFVLKSDASGNGAWVNPNTLAVTNTLTNPTNTITSTVNGVSATAPAVNTVSNTSSTNTLSTTVNGVAGTGVNIINSNALTSATNTMTSTINGVASNAPIVNSNTKTWTQAGGMSDVVNGVSANVTPASGTINNVLGYDATGAPVYQSSTALSVSNIYTANGTLTGARTVTQGANTLAFTSTATNGFSVDGSTFSVDAANNRIGIGTTAPKNDLQIGQGGDPMIRIDGALNTSAAGHLRFSETYTSDYGFDIAHNSSTDELIFKGLSAGVASPDNLLVLKRFPTIGVGIGASPTGAGMLEVSGNTKTTNFQMTSGATNNFVLKSDASGNGAWVNPNTLAVTNTLTNPTNTITSTVNGVSATAPAVNTVSNTSSTNTLSTTVNGVAGTGVNIINSNALTSATNTMTSTINGVASNAPIVNSNTKTWTQAGGMSDVVNGVSANVTPASGTINNVLGYDATGAPVYQSSTALSVSNIYTANGTLTGARTVTQGANTLAFTSTATNGFSVDGTTFSVDAANDRVGIGTTTPAALLDIAKNGTDGGTWYGEKIYRAGNNTSTGYGLNVASEVFSGGGTGGNYYGVYSTAQWGNNNYGVYGKGLYGITGSYGLYGDATSSGATTNYGVYGTAANATNNWAGYFVGNGYFSGNLGIGTTTPTTQLHTTGTVRFANYTNGFLVGDATGTLTAPRSIAVSGTGIDIANGNGVAGNPTLSLNYGPTMAVASNGKYPVGNFGQFEPHGTYTDFNVTPNFWGWNYVQGNTNAPNTVSSQWYRQNISLGSNFAGRGAGGYSLELAYPRDRTAGAGFWSRTVENGVIGNWSRLDGFAHNVSSSLHPSMDDITGWTALTFACNDDAAYTVNWGFPFNIDGVNYTSGWISTNGILGFGGSTTTSFSNTALPTSLSNDPMLFFHWDDNSTDIIRYVVQGTAPNRNCFIQWSGSETLFCTTGGSKIMAYITLSEGSNVVSVRYLAQGSAADAQGAGATFGFQYAGGASAGSIPLGYNTKLLDDNATNQQFSIDF